MDQQERIDFIARGRVVRYWSTGSQPKLGIVTAERTVDGRTYLDGYRVWESGKIEDSGPTGGFGRASHCETIEIEPRTRLAWLAHESDRHARSVAYHQAAWNVVSAAIADLMDDNA